MTGWLCPRCSASNAPTLTQCTCSPLRAVPVDTSPWAPPPVWPSHPWWYQPIWQVDPFGPTITWCSASTAEVHAQPAFASNTEAES